MVTRAEIDTLAQNIRGRYGFARYNTRYIQAIKQGRRSGVISSQEYKKLYHYYQDVKKSRHEGKILRLEQAVKENKVNLKPQVIEADKERTFSGYKSPLLETERAVKSAQEEVDRQRSEQIFNNQAQAESQAQADKIAEQIALRQALQPSTRGIPIDQEIRITREEPKDKPPETFKSGFVGFFKDVGNTFVSGARGVGKVLYDPFETGRTGLTDLGIDPKVTKDKTFHQWEESTFKVYGGRSQLVYDVDVQTAGKLAGASILAKSYPNVIKWGVRTIPAVEGYKFFKDPSAEQGGRVVASTLLVATSELAPKVITKVKTKYNQWKFDRAVKGMDNKIFLKHEYVNLEGVDGSQRDLYGRSISDKQVNRALAEINKNKIAFGIEQNTLNPRQETILNTGQKTLIKNQIVALDPSGRVFPVKVVDHTPYVLDPKINKYVEFVSGKYSLFTIPENTGLGSIKAEQINLGKVFTDKPVIFPDTKQTLLVEPKVDRSFKILKSPTPPTPPTPPPLKVVSSGVSSTRLKTTQDYTNILGSVTKTQPNLIYSPNVPSSPLKIDLNVKKDALFFFPTSNRERIDQGSFNINISDIKPDISPRIKGDIKPIVKPEISVKPRSALDIDLTALPKIKLDVAQKPKTIPELDVQQITQLTPALDLVQVQPQKQIFRAFPTPKPSPKPATPTTPFYFSTFSKLKPTKTQSRVMPKISGKAFKFSPTLKSVVFREVGKTPKINITTGLGNRFLQPITKKKKKKKGKKK